MLELPNQTLRFDSEDTIIGLWEHAVSQGVFNRAGGGTVAVAATRVDPGWWAANESWLKFNCELTDRHNVTFVRVFLCRDTAHEASLEDEMLRQTRAGITVFSVIESNITDPALRNFRDMMLIGCSITELDGHRAGIRVTGGVLVGKNDMVGDPSGFKLSAVEMSESSSLISNTADILTGWLQHSRRVKSDWSSTFFDSRYPKIASFKETEAAVETAFLRQQISRGTKSDEPRVLDIACAHGRTAVQLAKSGFSVLGVDISPDLVAEATTRSQRERVSDRVEFEVADMSALSAALHGRNFDAVVSVFNSFGYLDTDEENDEVLSQFVKALVPGGILVLDIDDKDYFIHNRMGKNEPGPNDQKWRWGTGDLNVECFHSYDFSRRRRRSRFRVSGNDGQSEMPLVSVRLYDASDIEARLRESGLHVLDLYSDFHGARYVAGRTEHMIVVCRKAR
jgi:SAM-dependent methyltransferase